MKSRLNAYFAMNKTSQMPFMSKPGLLFLCIFILNLAGISQVSIKEDSLLQLLQTAKEDTSTIRLLLLIQKQYATRNYDSSLFYLNKAVAYSKKLKTDKLDFYINTGFSEYYYYNNDYAKALDYAEKNKEIAEKENDLALLAKAYNNLAAVYNHFGQPKLAIESILKCLDLSEKTKDSASFPVRNLTASATYFNLNQFDKSILYARRAIMYGKQFNNSFAVMMGLNNLSSSYAGLNKLDSAIIANRQQLEFAEQEEDIVNINYALANICHDYFKLGDLKSLGEYAGQLVKYSKDYPDHKMTSQIQNAFALNFIAQRKFSEGKAALDSGMVVALGEDDADALANLYQSYSVLYFMQGQIKPGEYFVFKHDSVINAGNWKDLDFYSEELEAKYNTEKKEAQIKLQQTALKQKTTLNYFLIGGAGALFIISLLGYRNYRNLQKLQQAKIDELETEKQLTATEAVLKGEEQERTRLAKDLHDGLGGMLSGIKYSLSNMKENLIMTPDNTQAFERSMDMLDSSIREMRRVAHNMMPEILVKYGLDTALKEYCGEMGRSGMIKINYQSVGMRNVVLEQIAAVNIYRIIQELVTNSMKHAAAKNILVQVHAAEQEKLVAITVEDDGSGFDGNVANQQGGIGWQNIHNRVEFLKGKIDVQSSAGKGTSVMIEIAST